MKIEINFSTIELNTGLSIDVANVRYDDDSGLRLSNLPSVFRQRNGKRTLQSGTAAQERDMER